jgi:retron-type reverse transcriptase
MKRAGGLWETLVSFENLMAAAKAAAAGKRSKPDVARFLLDQENELVRLRRELIGGDITVCGLTDGSVCPTLARKGMRSCGAGAFACQPISSQSGQGADAQLLMTPCLIGGAYQPGPYRTFRILDPKPRMISAAPFRDRVVHHALTRVLEPVFERRFAANSYACRRGYGVHRALESAADGVRRFRFALKCDIRKYFASMDHQILKEILARTIKCRETLALAGRIIDGSNPQEEAVAYFPGDSIFTPFERRRGLPLGNQTSQFFANVYLDPLDQFVNRTLRPGRYVRYVDDFLLFSDDGRELDGMRRAIEDFLAGFRLIVHPGKSRVYRSADGVTFLGWRIFPGKRRLVRGNVVRFRRRLRDMQRSFGRGEIEWEQIRPRVEAWIAHASHGDTWRLRERIFSEIAFSRGSVT